MIVTFELTETVEEAENSYIKEVYFDDYAKISDVTTKAKQFIDEFEKVTSVRFYFDNSFYMIENPIEVEIKIKTMDI
mgnify:CR=1 FL=1